MARETGEGGRTPKTPGEVPDAFFRLAVEASPIGKLITDREGRIVLVNAQIERMFGYPRAELVGRWVEMLIPERLRGQHPSYRSGFLAESRARPMGAGRDLFGLRKDGSEVPIEIGLTPLTTDEGVYILSSIVDITERRRAAEQLRASLDEKELLLKEVHHRVKNNLQVISSLLSLQSRSVSDPRAAAILQESQNRVQSISLVHENLYEAGDLGRVDFVRYLHALTDNLKATWDPARVSVVVEASALRLPVDVAVPCGLIVNELVTNAFKHAFPTGRPGTVRVCAEGRPDGVAWVAVADDGVGMPREVAERWTGAGHTMGMMMVRTLAKQLGAEVEIVTGAGTAVELRFKVTR